MRNKSEAKLKPKPGSQAARQVGCSCPVMDNHHGAGRGGDGKKYGWYQNGNCTIHGFEDPEPAPKPKTERKNPGFATPRVAPRLSWQVDLKLKGPSEKFLVSDFREYGKREYSKVLAGFQKLAEDRFRCPNCNMALEESPPHGRAAHHGCGVSFLALGNSLQIWRTGK